jgi:phosphoadenosine phosphosulfate reductase
VLETGRLHKETLALIPQIEAKYNTKLDIYYPQAESAAKYVADHGLDAIYQSIKLRKACCDIRKMEPLARALAGKAAWITGLRREQSNARADVGAVEFDGPKDAQGKPTRAKINPLIDWTLGDVWHFVSQHAVAYNPLHDQFFPSIGCEPCTRAVTLGEDFRSGRWWWEDEAAKECGLHVKKVIPISGVSA